MADGENAETMVAVRGESCRLGRPLVMALTMLFAMIFAPLQAVGQDDQKGASGSRIKRDIEVYAVTFRHQEARDAMPLVRKMLSPNGSVEERPGGNTIVVRDTAEAIGRLRPLLEQFDHPPENLRFDVRVVRAGPRKEAAISPPLPDANSQLPADLVDQLRGLLRYEDYRVLAGTSMTSREGENVTYDLGANYRVTFRLGPVLSSPRSTAERLRLENFRIVEKAPRTTDKSRRLEPKELYNATFNLWINRHFTLVLTQDETRNEALIVAISCRRETIE